MATTANSRTRLLCLVDILTTYSDELNILSADEICEKLKEYGFNVSKRNVLSDIKAINTTPIEIICVNKPKKGYYLAKSYSPAATQLILEAIFSSEMLSADDIEYIKTYLRRNICVPTLELVLSTTRNFNSLVSKADISLEVLRNLRFAIKDKKKVTISISHLVPGDRFSYSERLEDVTVTPIYIAVANGSVSLTFLSDENLNELEYINISRIRSAVITDETAACIKDYKTATNRLSKKTVSSEQFRQRWLILECRNKDIEIIESYFRAPVQYRKSEKEGFCLAKVHTVFSRELIGWLFLNCDKISIIAPDSLIELFKNKAKNIF